MDVLSDKWTDLGNNPEKAALQSQEQEQDNTLTVLQDDQMTHG